MIQSPQSRRILVAALLWFGLALGSGAAGLLERAGPPLPQLILLGLTVGLVYAGVSIPDFRAWALRIDLRAVVALHLTRFIGIYFLALFRQGQLPFAFAVPGGWGDILVAALALLLLPVGSPRTGGRRLMYAIWNLIGLVELLFVVVTAARLGLTEPESMRALTRLPLSLLPTFLVPLLLASHLLIGVRLARA